MSSDINGVDWLGRTVLHLACSSLESIEYVRILLRHPAINVNIPDVESHWTPLHRALYHANIPAAILLLQRTDTDTFLKDIDGYTAIDLYNSTIHGTKPERQDTVGAVSAELFTWGANRNASLGMGDGGDRLNPEHVIIPPKDGPLEIPQDIRSRFSFINARQIQMSRLHTAVITTESNGNLRLCGFGNGGRLGPGQHTQYSLKSLPITQVIVAVALGQDHTLALTNAGEVLSWGLNRFSQLGYIIESDVSARPEELIQTTPRKIPSLKKEYVKGVAASKSASACWTSDEVFTWGTNGGQLGYDKATQPVQILPRRVTKITGPVIAISMTDTAMACLLEKHHVILMWNDRHTRIQFPDHAFPSEIQPYLLPQAIKDTKIAKVTSCDDTFAALASNGELFIFSAPSDSTVAVKPQRVVALRKQFSPVRDVALGADGSIIICTESGHVFVRSRNAKAGQGTHAKTSKFQRIAHIQRVTHPIEIRGNTLAQDLRRIQPYLAHQHEEDIGGTGWEGFSLDLPASRSRASSSASNNPLYEESDDRTIENDIEALSSLAMLYYGNGPHAKFHLTKLERPASLMVQIYAFAFHLGPHFSHIVWFLLLGLPNYTVYFVAPHHTETLRHPSP
ncbi:regulator of chromosome condensation 1/beta-lactamase-inhibitor protein II [Infundibulicybe gibba]|nr:regulator of chromosome condensation 1/beta-lactamase-inhibitor protein II [Infundibulicybe gibba]